MINKLVLAVVVAVVVTLACVLVGGILQSLSVSVATTVGNFLVKYSYALGVLAGLWYYFAGGSFNFPNRSA